jgi:hypothetical protein
MLAPGRMRTPSSYSQVSSLLRVGLAAVSVALPLSDAHAREARKTHAEMVLDVIDGHVIPRLEQLRDATERLTSDLKSLCADPGDAGLRRRVEERFGDVVGFWGGVDFVRFGPASEASRLERFFFWPDPRAVTERQLLALLARRDPALLEPGALASQSVAVQGLGAIEFIAYNDKLPLGGPDEDAQYRCAFAAAIAANLEAIARDVATGWTAPHGWRAKMLAPGSDNPTYKDASETAREVVKTLLTGLQIAQDRHVSPRLEAATADPPKRVRIPFERSNSSARYLEQELRSLAALFDATGLADYVPPDKVWMKAFIPRSFQSLVADVAILPRPVHGEPVDENGLATLRKMRFDLNGLRQIINRELAPAAGLVLGFNELDGD